MAGGFDDLIDFLLQEIALLGEKGLAPSEFRSLVERFYEHAAKSSGDGDGDETADGQTPTKALVDELLVERVWAWLMEQPDVSVGQEGEFNNLSLKEALEVEAAALPSPPEVEHADGGLQIQAGEASRLSRGTSGSVESPALKEEGTPEMNTPVEQETDATPVAYQEKIRIYTSEERVWHAMTGHGIDHKRIPAMEFHLLCVIAAQGSKGIIQPQLVKLSGQDKRSLPRRTDSLQAKGYIVKKSIVQGGIRTSILILRRFVEQPATASTEDRIKIFDEGQVHIYKAVDAIYEVLKGTKIMPVEDVIRPLGFDRRFFRYRLVRDMFQRLAVLGVIAQVKVKVSYTKSWSVWKRGIRLLRTPTDKDRKEFATLSKADMATWARQQTSDANGDDNGDDDADSEVEDTPMDQDTAIAPSEMGDEPIPKRTNGSHWDPDRLIPNILYEHVDKAGEEGVSSMDLRNSIFGPLWRRPFDAMMTRLTDAWEISQPETQRHLRLVRDTAVKDKTNHYLYRTVGHYQSLVDQGKGDWDIVSNGHLSKQNRKDRAKREPFLAQPDPWGFPTVTRELLAKTDGTAPLPAGPPGRVFAFKKQKQRTTFPLEDLPGLSKEMQEQEQGPSASSTPKKRGRPLGSLNKPKSPTAKRLKPMGKIAAEKAKKAREEAKRYVAGVRRQAEKLAAWQLGEERKRKAADAGLDPDEVNIDMRAIKRVRLQEKDSKVTKPTPQPTMTTRKRGRPRKHPLPPEPAVANGEGPAGQQEDTTAAPQPSPAPRKRGRPRKNPLPAVVAPQAESEEPSNQQDNTEDANTAAEPAAEVPAPTSEEQGAESNDIKEAKKELDERTEEIVNGILNRTRTGVYIRPLHGVRSFPRGRPKKTFVIVIKLDALKQEVLEPAETTHIEAGDAEASIEQESADETTRSDVEMEESNELPEEQIEKETPALDAHDSPKPASPRIADLTEEPATGTVNQPAPVPEAHLELRAGAGSDEDMEDIDEIAMEAETEQPSSAATSRKQTILKPSFRLWSLSDQTKRVRKNRNTVNRRPGVHVGGGTTARTRVKILLDLTTKCNGVIPGGRAIFPAFEAAWKELHPNSSKVDSKTIDRALASMVETGKLKQVEFHCDKNGAKFPHSVYLFPQIDANSPQVDAMRENIRAAHPGLYRPPELGILPGPKRYDAPRADLFPKDETVQFTEPPAKPMKVIEKEEAIETARLRAEARRMAREQASRDREEMRQARQLLRESKRNSTRSIRKLAHQRGRERRGYPMPHEMLEQGAYGLSFAAHLSPTIVDPRKFGILVMKGHWMITQCSSVFHAATGTFSTVTHVPQLFEQAASDDVALRYIQIVCQMRAHHLMMRPTVEFHEQSGTFGTIATVPDLSTSKRRGGGLIPYLSDWDPHLVQQLTLPGYHPSMAILRPQRHRAVYDPIFYPHARKVTKPPSFVRVNPDKPLSFSAKYFVMAIVAVQTLVGGVDQGINWILVTYILRGSLRFELDTDAHHMRYRWDIYRESLKDWLHEVVQSFREAFLEGYERGQLKTLDFEKPYDYDWIYLVKWAMKRLPVLSKSPNEFKRNPFVKKSLPATRAALDESCSVEWEPVHNLSLPEKFYKDKTNGTHRATWMHSVPFELDVFAERKSRDGKGKTRTTDEEGWQTEKRMVKSYVRAVIATPEDQYKPLLARDILAQCPHRTIDRAISELSRKSIITKRFSGPHPPPGRSYQIADQVHAQFDRQITAETYIEAARFKADLDQVFSTDGTESVFKVPFAAKNGTMLVILNLVANGRCSVAPVLPRIINTHQPILRADRDAEAKLLYSKWGWLNGGYNTRIMDRKYLEFHVEVRPTARYLPGNPFVDNLPDGAVPAPPTTGDDFAECSEAYRGCYPLWLDHRSQPIAAMWERVIMAVVQIVSFRPGIDSEGLSRAFKGIMEPWELEICLQWLEKVGGIARVSEKDEWTVKEWWWMIPAALKQSGPAEASSETAEMSGQTAVERPAQTEGN